MVYHRIWIVMAVVALSASMSCSRGSDTTADNGRQENQSDQPESPPAQPAGEGTSTGQHAGSAHGETRAPVSFEAPPQPGTRAHCPVMGHDFTISESSPRSEHNGRHFVFCCPDCKPRFDADPAQYLSAQSNQT